MADQDIERVADEAEVAGPELEPLVLRLSRLGSSGPAKALDATAAGGAGGTAEMASEALR